MIGRVTIAEVFLATTLRHPLVVVPVDNNTAGTASSIDGEFEQNEALVLPVTFAPRWPTRRLRAMHWLMSSSLRGERGEPLRGQVCDPDIQVMDDLNSGDLYCRPVSQLGIAFLIH